MTHAVYLGHVPTLAFVSLGHSRKYFHDQRLLCPPPPSFELSATSHSQLASY